jgi:seryl-tRNA synthetase
MEEEEKEETKEKIVVDVPEVAKPTVVEDKKKEENVEIKKKTFNFPTRFVPVNR